MRQILAKPQDFEVQALPHLEDPYRTALLVLDNESEAQQLVQESLINAYCSWHKIHPSQNQRTWLFRTMMNNYAKKYRPFPSLSEALDLAFDAIDGEPVETAWSTNSGYEDEPDEFPISVLSENDLKGALRSLPADFRLIVVLALLDGFSCQEISDIVGIHLETVKSRLPRSRRLMRERLSVRRCTAQLRPAACRVRSERTG